ncbi:hypothetical protein P7C73_g6450, partial [Tremellales sp. Uapishka_1]
MDMDPWANAPSSPKPASLPSSPKHSTPQASRLSQEFTAPEREPVHEAPIAEAIDAEEERETPEEPAATNDEFEDFDDFDEPAAGPSTSNGQVGDDDGFGDFGDFEEGDEENVLGGQVDSEPEPVAQAEKLPSLHLDPFPSSSRLINELSTILRPVFSSNGQMTDEPPRMVGGLGQILVAESSRDAYAQLTTPPILKPLDWTRSRVRREHLISMGVPVNLDEVDSHRLSALPPLRITTTIHTSSAPYSSLDKGKQRESPVSINGNGVKKEGKYGLGEQPHMDMSKAEELCGIEGDQLSILSLATLRKMQDDLVRVSADASASLAWSLQYKDAQTQDSVMHNGMISELIANAAKLKSAQAVSSGGGVFRRASNRQSGIATPRRVGSPGTW